MTGLVIISYYDRSGPHLFCRRCLLPLRSRPCLYTLLPPTFFSISLFFSLFLCFEKSCRISPIPGDAILAPLYT